MEPISGNLFHPFRVIESLLYASLLHASMSHASLLHATLLYASLLHASLSYASLLHASLLNWRFFNKIVDNLSRRNQKEEEFRSETYSRTDEPE